MIGPAAFLAPKVGELAQTPLPPAKCLSGYRVRYPAVGLVSPWPCAGPWAVLDAVRRRASGQLHGEGTALICNSHHQHAPTALQLPWPAFAPAVRMPLQPVMCAALHMVHEGGL
jgi:hypothetical protein